MPENTRVRFRKSEMSYRLVVWSWPLEISKKNKCTFGIYSAVNKRTKTRFYHDYYRYYWFPFEWPIFPPEIL